MTVQTQTFTDDQVAELRTVIAEALDHPFSEAGFAAVDAIQDAIVNDELTDTDEITEAAIEMYSGELVAQWLGLNAQNYAGSNGLAVETTDAMELIRADVAAMLYDAADTAVRWVEENTEDDSHISFDDDPSHIIRDDWKF